jgi:hypothetical protein
MTEIGYEHGIIATHAQPHMAAPVSTLVVPDDSEGAFRVK